MIAGRFTNLKAIGSGAFSRVYSATDAGGGQVAIKVDVTGTKSGRLNQPLIFYEASVLRTLEGIHGVPRLVWQGEIRDNSENDIPAIAMQALGVDLESALKERLVLPARAAAILTSSLMTTLETIHDRGILHRDIKPANVLLGGAGDDSVYLCDYGLSKRYIDDAGQHISQHTKSGVTGTMRFCSRHTHQLCESSRRDDIESIVYMLISLVTNHLPWQSPPKRTKDEIALIKNSVSAESLCTGCPREFVQIVNMVRELQYDERPPYEEIRQLLKRVR